MQLRRRTRRRRGGDVQHDIFDKIISIGYEFESPNFAKLSLIKDTEEGDEVLLNTDTVAKNIPMIQGQTVGGEDNPNQDEEDEYAQEFEEEEEEDDEESIDQEGLELRRQETIQFPAYTTDSIDTTAPISDPNVLFQALNDITNSPFNINLLSMCKDMVDAQIAMKKVESDQEEPDEDSILHEIKNSIYRFETFAPKTYRIHFQTWAENDCASFCDTEWLFTYFKPQPSRDIVVNTFFNAIKNLSKHFSVLESIPGKLVANFSEEDQEVVDKPETRILFHYPNTNMYYLQTHRLNKQLTTDDVCIVPQMTFAADAQYIPHIVKELVRDTRGKLEFSSKLAEQSIQVLERVEQCTQRLFDQYNQDAGEIIFDPNNELVKRIHTYLYMILYKLERFYNSYYPMIKKTPDTKDHVSYFKNHLVMNSRHNNSELYANLKSSISELMGSDTETVNIIRDLILQPKILETVLLTSPSRARKNAFNEAYKLDKTDKNYGNPYYSLTSFLQFFEDPISDEKVDGVNDWFIQASIDIYTATMPIRDHIVLVEFRIFQYMMRGFASSFGDETLLEDLKNGICNKGREDVAYLSMRGLKRMIYLYEHSTSSLGGRKQKKRTKTIKMGSR